MKQRSWGQPSYQGKEDLYEATELGSAKLPGEKRTCMKQRSWGQPSYQGKRGPV